MNRLQMQLGFTLILLALLSGLVVPFAVNPRLALAAHTVGILGGLVLVALGALAPQFVLSPRWAAAMMGCWAYAAYANWFACLLGGLTGASRLTPLAGAGTSGSGAAEAAVAFLLQSLALTAIVGTAAAVWGLRSPRVHVYPAAPPAADPALAVDAGPRRLA